MPTNARVTLCHGPYESNGIVQHRTFRLRGLQAALRARGYRCVLEETPERNQVELVVNGELVFRCRIKQLEFGGDGKLDPVCKEAVTAVDEAPPKRTLSLMSSVKSVAASLCASWLMSPGEVRSSVHIPLLEGAQIESNVQL